MPLERLDSPDYRLITLVGLGGVGKTRLALQAARAQLGAFDHGVFWVPLASITSPELLSSSIAQAISYHFEAVANPAAQLIDYLHDKEMLLVLDNFEHLLAGAEAPALLLSILRGAPRISMLVTSRERLDLQAEHLVDLSGLPVPSGLPTLHDPSELLPYDAVQLFVERAQQARSQFALSDDTAQGVIDICRLVAGLPLGIVLAAAWVRHFSPARIASSLKANLDFLTSTARDASPQHASLRAVFDYSWSLLPEEEKPVFRNLAVFRGAWEESAAERIAGASLLTLLSLVDKSLLRQDASGRFDMHEVLRQYAAEKLAESLPDRDEIKRRHAEYYLELAELAEPELRGEEQDKWLQRLEREHDNLRTVLRWARENEGLEEISLRLGTALWRFWYVRGYYSEGREQLAAVLAMPAPTGNHTSLSAAAVPPLGAARPAEPEGPPETANQSRITELMRTRAKVLNGAGVLASVQGDSNAARALYEESLALSRDLGDKQGMASSLNNLGIMAHQQGDSDAGRALQEESLALRRELGDTLGISASLNNLGLVAQEQGDYDAARSLHQESLTLRVGLGERIGIAGSLACLGGVITGRASQGSRREPGSEKEQPIQEPPEQHAQLERAASERAATLFGAVDKLLEGTPAVLTIEDRELYEQNLAAVRSLLNEETFAKAWAEGRAMATDQAIAHALED